MNKKTGQQLLADVILDVLWAAGLASMKDVEKMREYCAQKLQ